MTEGLIHAAEPTSHRLRALLVQEAADRCPAGTRITELDD